jgi:hypothetical protein
MATAAAHRFNGRGLNGNQRSYNNRTAFPGLARNMACHPSITAAAKIYHLNHRDAEPTTIKTEQVQGARLGAHICWNPRTSCIGRRCMMRCKPTSKVRMLRNGETNAKRLLYVRRNVCDT